MDTFKKQTKGDDATLIASNTTAVGQEINNDQSTVVSQVSEPFIDGAVGHIYKNIHAVENVVFPEYNDASSTEAEGSDAASIDIDGVSLCSEQSCATVVNVSMKGTSSHDQKGFVKLSSMQKRRLKAYMSQGHSRNVALDMVSKLPTRAPTKRTLSDDMVMPAGKKPKQNTSIQGSSKPSFSQVASQAKGIKLGFVPFDLAKCPLNREQIEQLQEAIIETAIELASDEVKPEFEGCYPRTGWLMVVCTNIQTAEWVRKNAAAIATKAKLGAKVVEESEFPKTHLVRGYFPHSYDFENTKVLATIEAQNRIKASTWKVLQRTAEGSLLHIVFAVDDASWNSLVQSGGRIAYRFSHVKLLLKANNMTKEGQPEQRPVEQKVPNKLHFTRTERQKVEHVVPQSILTSTVTPSEAPTTSRAGIQKRLSMQPPVGGASTTPNERHRERGPRRARFQKEVERSLNKTQPN
ncbi:uncharacterized protein LOC119673898 [Teleopsis dalmanni]|uniref:uncharacterized protein LOC119673898 n=1 Tax=Teleopsis dalmanni TaxID=139649 RepID=UPI0018CDA743|nr:uncharacterized protein LOC119673898 [Teleopsis dalmanni]